MAAPVSLLPLKVTAAFPAIVSIPILSDITWISFKALSNAEVPITILLSNDNFGRGEALASALSDSSYNNVYNHRKILY
jgi:hypothetical protein